MEVHIQRTGAALNDMCENIKPFLASLDDVDSPSRAQRIAFDLLERFHYQSKAILPLLEELAVNHNMAVPLSQIFRAMVYDSGIAYWLFEEASSFDTRMDFLNHDYVTKNSKKVATFKTSAEMQNLWKSWQSVVPSNFTEVPNGNGTLEIANLGKNPHRAFESVCEHIIQIHPESFIKSIPLIYAILSQQAHVSEFSKLIIYNRYASNLKAFDAITKIVLHTVLFLLGKIDASESIQAEIAYSLSYFYRRDSADDMKFKLG